MQISLISFLTILGMGIVTYLTRIGGLWLMKYIHMSQWLKNCMQTLPGTILVSLIAPAVFTTSLANACAALLTLIIAVKTHRVLLAMFVGLIAVLVLRSLSGSF